jgi:hypothetical protein
MPRIAYIDTKVQSSTRSTIENANRIIAEYNAQGFQLTLRQLYYQFVSRGMIPNNDKEYKKLGDAVSTGRLAGLIDWNAIVDRTRNLRSVGHWGSPSSIMDSAASSYRIDKWDSQPNRIEVWIEKDALVGVIEGVCTRLDLPYFSCRGYTSQSEMWAASQRLIDYKMNGQTPIILHLGDHDPSGKDMTRDIIDRMRLFGLDLEVERLALNYDQVQQYQPPPNPTKITDSRADGYIAQFGYQSWELDALEPRVIADLIETATLNYRDDERWDDVTADEQRERDLLKTIAERWEDVVEWIENES